MPDVWIKYNPKVNCGEILGRLADEMPGIAAAQMNIPGRELHNGGVTKNEINLEFFQFTPHDRNPNDIKITLIAHNFKERIEHHDEATRAIKEDVITILSDFDHNIKVSVSIWLINMSYETI